jgi:hypothetical protein
MEKGWYSWEPWLWGPIGLSGILRPMSEDNVEVVRAYIEAYNAGGDAFVDFVVDFMAEDVEIHPG